MAGRLAMGSNQLLITDKRYVLKTNCSNKIIGNQSMRRWETMLVFNSLTGEFVNTATFEIVSKLVRKAPKFQGSFHAFLHIEKVHWKCWLTEILFGITRGNNNRQRQLKILEIRLFGLSSRDNVKGDERWRTVGINFYWQLLGSSQSRAKKQWSDWKVY